MKNFKPGDRARVKKNATATRGLEFVRGQEVTLISRSANPFHIGYWTIDLLAPAGRSIDVHERDLEPIVPLGSWDEINRMLGKDVRAPLKTKEVA